jgi:hypothetical protein
MGVIEPGFSGGLAWYMTVPGYEFFNLHSFNSSFVKPYIAESKFDIMWV